MIQHGNSLIHSFFRFGSFYLMIHDIQKKFICEWNFLMLFLSTVVYIMWHGLLCLIWWEKFEWLRLCHHWWIWMLMQMWINCDAFCWLLIYGLFWPVDASFMFHNWMKSIALWNVELKFLKIAWNWKF